MPTSLITSLPLGEADRIAVVQCANEVFETVLTRMEPDNVETIRRLWDVEHYVDTLLKEDMLPIERDYALSLVEAFLVHHVVDLACQADSFTTTAMH